jgi:hypothetical protein
MHGHETGATSSIILVDYSARIMNRDGLYVKGTKRNDFLLAQSIIKTIQIVHDQNKTEFRPLLELCSFLKM